jgi:diaminopimelate epimerase
MKQRFEKYQATGNDFIIINEETIQFDSKNYTIIRNLCDRHFGIGADGLIIYRPHSLYDFEMLYYNADGLPSSFCGNGARAIIEYAYNHNFIQTKGIFKATDSNHLFAYSPNKIGVQMRIQSLIKELDEDTYELNTGSPHYIKFTNELPPARDFLEFAQNIRYSPPYQEKGINVNMVASEGGSLRLLTYERGVENITLSCGTGVTAAALVAYRCYKFPIPILIHTLGGTLQVQTNADFSETWLYGSANKVFEGEIYIKR